MVCIQLVDRFHMEIKYESIEEESLRIIAASCLYIACGLYENYLFDIGYLAKLSATNAPQMTVFIKRIALCLEFKLHNSLVLDAFVNSFHTNKFEWFCLIGVIFSFEDMYMNDSKNCRYVLNILSRIHHATH